MLVKTKGYDRTVFHKALLDEVEWSMGSRCVATCTLHEVSQETADIFSSKKNLFLIFFCFLEKKLMWRGFTTNRNLFKKSDNFRQVLQTRIMMVTGGDVAERLEKRAVETEETIALLKSQLLFLQKAAG